MVYAKNFNSLDGNALRTEFLFIWFYFNKVLFVYRVQNFTNNTSIEAILKTK